MRACEHTREVTTLDRSNDVAEGPVAEVAIEALPDGSIASKLSTPHLREGSQQRAPSSVDASLPRSASPSGRRKQSRIAPPLEKARGVERFCSAPVQRARPHAELAAVVVRNGVAEGPIAGDTREARQVPNVPPPRPASPPVVEEYHRDPHHVLDRRVLLPPSTPT